MRRHKDYGCLIEWFKIAFKAVVILIVLSVLTVGCFTLFGLVFSWSGIQ